MPNAAALLTNAKKINSMGSAQNECKIYDLVSLFSGHEKEMVQCKTIDLSLKHFDVPALKTFPIKNTHFHLFSNSFSLCCCDIRSLYVHLSLTYACF